MGLCAQSAADCAYVFASANLFNTALNPNLGLYTGSLRLCKEGYSFKSAVAAAIEGIIAEPIDGVSCYFDPDGIAYVTVLGSSSAATQSPAPAASKPTSPRGGTPPSPGRVFGSSRLRHLYWSGLPRWPSSPLS